MGFSTLIDILGSSLIGGFLFLILLRINDAAVKNSYINNGELIIQKNLVETVQLLEHDFRKIGYCSTWNKIPNPAAAIIAADTSAISFLTDTDKDGTVDTLRYYLGTKAELNMTQNPNDRMLYRIVNNNNPVGANLGITEFKITYFDALGNTLNYPIIQPSLIYSMQIDLKVENTSGYDQEYTTAFWRQIRLAARNLRNR
ncbi:MAG: hypothetical protein JW995_11865 [Melioribacteraceae bacterium]|nr:hypothetical protein [Melioribacteraceae bacterium]